MNVHSDKLAALRASAGVFLRNILLRTAATLSDVAEKAGVSKQAVSAVLLGSQGGTRVSEATRQRILEAVATLQYRPNAVARSLRRRQTDIIGVYVGYSTFSAEVPFVGQLLTGLQTGCAAHRKDLLLHSLFQQASVENIYSELADGKIDGIVVFAAQNDPLVAQIIASRLAVAAIVEPIPAVASAVADDAGAGRQMLHHLAEKGHRRILYRQGGSGSISLSRRYESFCREAERAGIQVLTLHASETPDPLTEAEVNCLSGPKSKRPTALVCFADYAAFVILEDLRLRGIRVPHDLAVAGSDGIQISFMPKPAYDLTTIRIPWQKVAENAVNLLVAQMQGKEVPPETVLPIELNLGTTT